MAGAPGSGPVGASVARPVAPRLAAGRGRYTDDIRLPRMAHVAFVRSPHAHAEILGIDATAAKRSPGVVRVVTGAEIAALCAPWSGTLANLPTFKSPPQQAMAVERAAWQGEPVVAVVADSRAEAEDAAEKIAIEWRPLAVMAEPAAALAEGAALVHPALGSNLAFSTKMQSGEPERAFRDADIVLDHEFSFGRHTGVPLEPRGIIAEFDPTTRNLTVHQSHQTPHQMQSLYARHLGLDEHNVRVICPDVGGGFGIKLHLYGDEIAVAAIAVLLGRPVKFVADRLESFVSDVHARDHRVRARIALARSGEIMAIAIDDLMPLGAYASHPRNGISEGTMALGLAGAPYKVASYRGELTAVFQNKNQIGMYRAVGQPIACVVTEQLIDLAAAALGRDPVAYRRQSYIADHTPSPTPGGMGMQGLSLRACLEKLVADMGYDRLRREQADLRARGIHRGIGVATFVELSAVGPDFIGPSGAQISTQDGCTIKLEPSGKLRCLVSVTDQGQGTLTGIAQLVAGALGVRMEDVSVLAGDSAMTPYGGGAWASRGLAIGGEAAHIAASALKANILALAGAILQADPSRLDIADGHIRDATGPRLSLAELGAIGYFRQDILPANLQPELTVTRHYVPRGRRSLVGNGVQGSYLELDAETGFIRLLGHWVVGDCGRVVNPLLVDSQMQGGIVQGLGAVLLEELVYDSDGQLRNASLADYLVPFASDMPDIHVGHVETSVADTAIGVKGAGEAGVGGATAAVWLAVNDALRPLGARVTEQPFTPARILQALARAAKAR